MHQDRVVEVLPGQTGASAAVMTESPYAVEILNASDPLDDWDRFVDDSPQGCIFCRSWWLRAVCGDWFKILVLHKGGRIAAGMPLPWRRQFGCKIVSMPRLTQTLGVLLAKPTKTTYEGILSDEMAVLDALVSRLPKVDYFSVNFHYSYTNWLPFYWAGYQQTTGYTYVIPDLRDLGRVFSGFAHSKRKNVNKAAGLVKVHTGLGAQDFYANHRMTLKKQGQEISHSYSLFKSIHDAAISNEGGGTWYATDNEGNLHAAILVVYDSKSAYYLISSIDPDYRGSGAATLLVRDAITYLSQYTERFDFEGSMIRGVEESFRKFGAVQKPYFNITRNSLPGIARVCVGIPRIRAILNTLSGKR